MTNAASLDRSLIAALILFAAIGGLTATDIASDPAEGTPSSHIVFAALAMAIALSGAAVGQQFERWGLTLAAFFFDDLLLAIGPARSRPKGETK